MPAPVTLPLAMIYTRDDGRPVVKARMGALTDSLKAIGLQSPISVRPCQRYRNGQQTDAYEIVAGRHRYEAARALGWLEIQAVVMDGDPEDAELWEIDENFARAELTDAQRAGAHARREELLIIKGVVRTGRGPEKVSDKLSKTPNYADQAAASLGVDPRTVRRDLARGKNIAPEVLAAVEGTDLDKGVILDELARTPRDQQAARLIELRQDRSRVSPAADPLNDGEATERQLAALMAAWNRAGPDARQRFLDRVETPVFDRGAA